MTDLPRDDDGKRADSGTAATYKFEPLDPDPANFQYFPGTRMGSNQPHGDLPCPDSRCAAPDPRLRDGSPVFDDHRAPMASGRGAIVTGVFDGLEPAVTRIGECYPGAAAAAVGTGLDGMGRPVGGEINPEFQQRRPRIAGFDRPVDVDFDSALLRQLDEQQRLGAADAASPAGLEAFHQDELARRRAALTDAAFEAGPLAAGRPVPARHTAPPYSWMADLPETPARDPSEDEWSGTEPQPVASPGWVDNWQDDVRREDELAARLSIALVGLVAICCLLAWYFYRR